MQKIFCRVCNIEFPIFAYEKLTRKYCSRHCFFTWRKNNFKHSQKTKGKISQSLLGNKHGFKKGLPSWIAGKVNIWVLGEKNINWKGDKVGYRSLHKWIRSRKDGGNSCEFCGKTKTTPKSIHLANKSQKYLRQVDDWVWLCVPCHKKFDNR